MTEERTSSGAGGVAAFVVVVIVAVLFLLAAGMPTDDGHAALWGDDAPAPAAAPAAFEFGGVLSSEQVRAVYADWGRGGCMRVYLSPTRARILWVYDYPGNTSYVIWSETIPSDPTWITGGMWHRITARKMIPEWGYHAVAQMGDCSLWGGDGLP